jgi:hypothetical protein
LKEDSKFINIIMMKKQLILKLIIEVSHKAETLKRDRFIIFQFKIP